MRGTGAVASATATAWREDAPLADKKPRYKLGSKYLPKAGLEPARGLSSVDFESTASTISPLRHTYLYINNIKNNSNYK